MSGQEHKHLWGPFGCWCGAKQCAANGYTDKDGKFVKSDVWSALRRNETKFSKCQAPATVGKWCDEHFESDEGWKDATFGG